MHFDDLADKTRIAYAHNVKHISVSHSLRNNERTGDLYYCSYAAHYDLFASILFQNVGAYRFLHSLVE